MPRCTYGSIPSGSPLGPLVPTTSPWLTCVPTETPIEPRWTSVTDQPSSVRTVRQSPWVGSPPANATTPVVAEHTSEPLGAPMSIPRCWPPAYGSPSAANGLSTGPSTGHAQADAPGASASAAIITTRAALPDLKTMRPEYRGDLLLSNPTTVRLGRGGFASARSGARRGRRPFGGRRPRPRARRRQPAHRSRPHARPPTVRRRP